MSQSPLSAIYRVSQLLLLLLCLPSAAFADKPNVELDPDTEVARRHFRAGSAAYESGDYATALQEFERARLVKPLADLDYNIGRCHDRLEHYPEAIAAYQRFVDATSNIAERTEISERECEAILILIPHFAQGKAAEFQADSTAIPVIRGLRCRVLHKS